MTTEQFDRTGWGAGMKVEAFNMQCDLYVERKIIIQDNNEIYE